MNDRVGRMGCGADNDGEGGDFVLECGDFILEDETEDVVFRPSRNRVVESAPTLLFPTPAPPLREFIREKPPLVSPLALGEL